MDPYEWDEAKYSANLRKHGIAFELIYRFDWSKAKYDVDDRFEYGETRRLAFGRIDGRVIPSFLSSEVIAFGSSASVAQTKRSSDL